ncbi:MAG: radical SAM protein [Planctomycetes bacterium]|nr:radical SAM protein [Planctomycetota bacterium]
MNVNLEKVFARDHYAGVLRLMVRRPLLTSIVVRYVKKKAYEKMVTNDPQNRPMQVRLDKYHSAMALLDGFVRSHRAGYISHNVLDRMMEPFVENVICAQPVPTDGNRNPCTGPPLTITMSPGKRCNLKCVGCYAASDPHCNVNLDFDIFDRILTEKAELWGSRFSVISGGEPFLYESKGKTLLDAVERHRDQMFMVYTNSTLITEEVASRMAELGNISPAISVEGFEKETDQRRGKGVYKKIMKAMANLRKAGVPFGISTTATKYNWDVITSRKFVDHFFLEQGAVYTWVFQYMPIGRAHTLQLMVTPDQRKEMLRRTWDFVNNDGYFIADFWNSGAAGNGCIAAGRPGGYLYINWDGDITPCVFIPFSAANIIDIYRAGGNLNTILETPFFKRIRQWQDNYGYAKHMENPDNWFAPCIIRDHLPDLLDAVRRSGAHPLDPDAAEAVKDNAYIRGLTAYGERFYDLTEEDWESRYYPVGGTKKNEPLPVGD